MGNSGSILPWDDWFYHVGEKKEEVQSLHSQATSLQANLNARVLKFNNNLANVKQVVASNSALVVIITVVKFNDQQLKDFQANLDALPPAVKGSIPAKFGMMMSELVAGGLLLKAVANFGSLMKNAIFTSVESGIETTATEGLVESGIEVGVEAGVEAGIEAGVEAGVELGVEAGVEGALAETGIGIIAAVGLDAIFGAINGAKERDELDSAINKLREAIVKLKKFSDDLAKKEAKLAALALQEQKRFLDIKNDLMKFERCDLLQGDFVPTNDTMPQTISWQNIALLFYSAFVTLRTTYVDAHKRSPNITREAIVSAVLLKVKISVTYDQLEDMWDVLARYSDDFKKEPRTTVPHNTARSFLGTNEYLRVGEYIVSPSKLFYATVQSDGNFVVYYGSDPNDNYGVMWASNKYEQANGQFFAVMQSDGNFVVYRGTGPHDNRGAFWAPNKYESNESRFFATIQDDGNFVVYRGTGPNDNHGAFWAPNTIFPGDRWYRIVSTKNTCLDDWGGKTGENSAALQPDDSPNSNNRKWKLVPTGDGWHRIVSTKNTCLDDWGGKFGENSAALQPDDSPNSNNRKWHFVPAE